MKPKQDTMKSIIQAIIGFWIIQAIDAKNNMPEQVHINLGSIPNEMVITWVCMTAMRNPIVQFGLKSAALNQEAKAEEYYYSIDKFYTYRALLSRLQFETEYYYRVGNKNDARWSKTFHFRTLKAGNDWLPNIVVIGDFGWQNAEILPFLEAEKLRKIDAIFHVGDFAYDLHDLNGEKGNRYMRMIENIAAYVPYMVLPGNHERTDNFTHYDSRFSMLGDYGNPRPAAPLRERINNFFHSIDIGPAHFVSITTEFYVYLTWGSLQIERQYRWLAEDLEEANRNRRERPWIIVFAHRPMYCFRIGEPETCSTAKLERPLVRTGIDYEKQGEILYGLEDVFYRNGVDMIVYGHEHFYVRLYPVYDRQAKFGRSSSNPYDRPAAPIQIITGCAGNRELNTAVNPATFNASIVAKVVEDYGYMRLIFRERKHLHIEQTSADRDNIVIDEIEIIKGDDYPTWYDKKNDNNN